MAMKVYCFILLACCFLVGGARSAKLGHVDVDDANVPLLSAQQSNKMLGSSVFEPSSHGEDAPVLNGRVCSFKNNKACDPAVEPCPESKECTDHDKACFTLWYNTTELGVQVIAQGCWTETLGCREHECVSTEQLKGPGHPYFCCCLTDRCNELFAFEPTSTEAPATPAPFGSPSSNDHWLMAAFYALVPVFGFALLIIAIYYVYRQRRFKKLTDAQQNQGQFRLVTTGNGNTQVYSAYSADGNAQPIQLLEVKARGRFGCVFRARRGDRIVAVKTFPLADEESWLREQQIYAVAGVKRHPNVLEFLGTEMRGAGTDVELWLITAYHEKGSLYDYLKANTLSLNEALHVASTMLSGLAFLHAEDASTPAYKPTIAHRDVKSRNVLLKDDLSACIADFGLAIKCEHGQAPNGESDTQTQVGTHRYMAPEVLEGATEFSAQAFRQIDVYAAGLVLWEVLSRTRIDGAPPGDYRLPFEEVLGSQPSVDAVQQLVVGRRVRPMLKDEWRRHSQLAIVCVAIEEMWDQEPDARISAGCALERLALVLAPMMTTVDAVVVGVNAPTAAAEEEALREAAPLLAETPPPSECSA